MIRYFKVKELPDPGIPLEVGSVIGVPKHVSPKRWEYINYEHARIRTVDLTNTEYFEEVNEKYEPVKYRPINLDVIQKDYEQYGYLEDYQVKWLLDVCSDHKNLLDILIKEFQQSTDFWDLAKHMEKGYTTFDVDTVFLKIVNDMNEKLRGSQDES